MQRMKYPLNSARIALSILFISFVFFLLPVYAQQKGEVKKEGLEVKAGQLAPLFALRNLEGNYISLKNYCGAEDTKVPAVLRKEKYIVIIDFFSTICIPCIEALPALHRIYEKYKDKGLKMFLVNIDPKPEEVLPKFIKENNIAIPVLLDMYSKTLEKYGFESVPHTVLIDKNRKILAVFKEEKDIDKKLDEKLSQILK